MAIWTVRFWALGVGLTAVTPHFGRSVTSLRAQNVDLTSVGRSMTPWNAQKTPAKQAVSY